MRQWITHSKDLSFHICWHWASRAMFDTTENVKDIPTEVLSHAFQHLVKMAVPSDVAYHEETQRQIPVASLQQLFVKKAIRSDVCYRIDWSKLYHFEVVLSLDWCLSMFQVQMVSFSSKIYQTYTSARFSFMGDTNCDRLRNHGALSALPFRKCLRRCTVNGFDCPWGRGLNKNKFQDVPRCYKAHLGFGGSAPVICFTDYRKKPKEQHLSLALQIWHQASQCGARAAGEGNKPLI